MGHTGGATLAHTTCAVAADVRAHDRAATLRAILASHRERELHLHTRDTPTRLRHGVGDRHPQRVGVFNILLLTPVALVDFVRCARLSSLQRIIGGTNAHTWLHGLWP